MAKSLFELGDNPTPRPQPRPKREPERKPARAPKVVKVQTRQQPARLDGMTFGLPMPSLMRTPAPKPQAPLHEAVRKPFPKAKPIQQDKARSKPAPKAKNTPKKAPVVAKRKPAQSGKDAVLAASPVIKGLLNAIGTLRAAPQAVADLPGNIATLPGTLERQARGLWEQTVRPAMEHQGAAQTLGGPGASSAAFGMAHGRPDVMASAQETFNDPAKTAASGRVVANTLPLMALGAASKPVQLAAGAAFGVPSAINLNKRRTGELPGFWEDPVMTAMDAAGVAFAPFAARGFVNSIRGLRTPTLPIERVLEPPVPVAEGMREPLLARRGAPVVREPAPAGTFVRKPAGTRMEKGAPLRRRATEKAPVEPAQAHPGLNKAQEPPVAPEQATPPVETGKPYRATLHRGEGDAPADAARNRIPNQYGEGEYWTPDKRVAETYGPNVRSEEVGLENPYVLDLSKNRTYAEDLQTAFGTTDPKTITQQLQGRGHDGLIVRGVGVNRRHSVTGEPYAAGDSMEVVRFASAPVEPTPASTPPVEPTVPATVDTTMSTPKATYRKEYKTPAEALETGRVSTMAWEPWNAAGGSTTGRVVFRDAEGNALWYSKFDPRDGINTTWGRMQNAFAQLPGKGNIKDVVPDRGGYRVIYNDAPAPAPPPVEPTAPVKPQVEAPAATGGQTAKQPWENVLDGGDTFTASNGDQYRIVLKDKSGIVGKYDEADVFEVHYKPKGARSFQRTSLSTPTAEGAYNSIETQVRANGETITGQAASPAPKANAPAKNAKKLSYEMSLEEYTAQRLEQTKKRLGSNLSQDQIEGNAYWAREEHMPKVKQAINEGKIQSHPDYPDLAPVQPSAPEPVPVDTPLSTPKATSGKKGAPVKGKKGSTSPAMENVAALPTARTTTAKAETVVRASDIVKDLDAAFAPIRTGRVNRPKAVGIFKGHAAVIRTKKANDLPTVAHETGHALQKLLWPESIGRKGRFTDKAFSPEHRAELRLLDYEPQKGRAYEGYAEFIRHYLTDPAAAQQKAPKFFKFFEAKIGEHPEVQAALRKAQADIARFIEQPNAAKVRSTISYENTPSRPSARDVTNRAYQLMVDELDPLRRAEEAITGGTPIKSTESAFKEAWRGRGISGKMEEWLFHGVTDKNGKKIAASLSERLKPVQGELTEWQDYAVARHALDVIDDGKTMPLSRDAYQSVVDAAPPHYQKVLESVVEYQDYVLEELVRSGMLSASAKADMRRKWPNHVPLYRDMGADLPKGMGKKQANLANPVKRLKGSGRDILPPVENIIRDTYAMLNVAQRNRVMLKLTSLAEKFGDSGRIVEKVPAKMKATSFTLDEVLTGDASILGTEKGDVSAAGIDLDTVKTIFRPNLAGSRSENIVVVYRNGKPELYQLEPGLYDAVTAADTASLGVLETLLVPFTASAKVLRAGATLDPSFAVRNPTRDLMTAMVNSESGLTPVDWVRGLFNTVGRTDLYHQFKASGAAHANLVSLDRDYLGLSVKQMRAKDAPAKVIDFVTHPIEALRALGEIGEESTRVAEFGKGTKWGKESDPSKVLDAALAARDITIDFSRAGLAGKHVNRITAFFNAAVGGADKTVRVFKQNPMRSTTRALAYITAPTVALYAINRNDKRYQDLPEWEKDMFWHIPTPNNGPMVRIPRPFEIGVVFGALPERIMRWIDKEDPHAFDQFSETMKGQLPNLMPTLLTPAWELHGNKSFTGAPIVPRGEQDLPPALQEGPDTTKTAKVIGKALDASPRKVDYAIRGYTGGLGRMANEGIIGPVASALGGDAKTVKPSKGITEAPVIKSFFVSPWQQGEDINRLYKERKRLMDKEAMEKAGQGALTPAERRALARLDSGASQLSALRKQMRQVQSENNAARLRAYAAQYGAEVADSPAQNKKAALLAIKQRMADTAAKANDK